MFPSQRKISLLFSGAALFTMPLVVHAQDAKPDAAPAVKAPDDAPVSWTLQHKKGEVKQFRGEGHMTGDSGMGPISVVLKTTQKREISKVEDSGALNWVSTTLSQSLTFNDNEIPDTSPKTSTMTMTNASGIATDLKSDVASQGGDTLQQLGGIIVATPVPPKPVKVGDSWNAQYDGKLYKGKKFTITYTYVGRETSLGKNAYKLQAKGDLPINASAKDLAKLTGTLYIDPASGDAIRAVYSVSNLDFPAGAGALKVNLDSETTQIIPGVNDKEDVKK